MEVFMIKSRYRHYGPQASTKLPTTTVTSRVSPLSLDRPTSPLPDSSRKPTNMSANYTLYPDDIIYANTTDALWNDTVLFNVTNGTDFGLDYDYHTLNISSGDENWALCNDWTAAQHNLFQTANLFFAAAFLVPMSFKQSVLIVRALLTFGFLFSTCWAGSEVCALDIMLWNTVLVAVNLSHTILLTWRFLPPTLTLELTDLYLKVFKPLRVSKKHFKELVKEAKVQTLETGDIYAIEDVSPADERLSLLLKGKLRVTCDETHLHFITTHQFVDSPEWEANHEQSDDVFQVTIAAEEDSAYLCWPRMRLERVLRHRPHLKVVLDSLIGKDITMKLYSVNELLAEGAENALQAERKRRRGEWGGCLHNRSLSVDAVNTGTTGHVRSVYFKQNQRKPSLSSSGYGSPARPQAQCFQPVIAAHFPAECPFTYSAVAAALGQSMPQQQGQYLLPPPDLPPPSSPVPRPRRAREVTFMQEVQHVP